MERLSSPNARAASPADAACPAPGRLEATSVLGRALGRVGDGGRLTAVAHLELGEHVAHMRARGLLGDEQRLGDPPFVTPWATRASTSCSRAVRRSRGPGAVVWVGKSHAEASRGQGRLPVEPSRAHRPRLGPDGSQQVLAGIALAVLELGPGQLEGADAVPCIGRSAERARPHPAMLVCRIVRTPVPRSPRPSAGATRTRSRSSRPKLSLLARASDHRAASTSSAAGGGWEPMPTRMARYAQAAARACSRGESLSATALISRPATAAARRGSGNCSQISMRRGARSRAPAWVRSSKASC